MNQDIANWIAESPLREWAFELLSNVPGLPPISQAIHILGVCVVMATVVLIDLRILGVAVRSQRPSEMVGRLLPWTWVALGVNVVTGLPYLCARPYRYFLNPVFGWKMAFLAPALLIALFVHLKHRRDPEFWNDAAQRVWAKVLALVSLLLWLGVTMGGRWIAYSDYIFWQG